MSNKYNYEEIFTNFAQKGGWVNTGGSLSGLGSSLEYTENFRKNLIRIIKEYDIENIFDCSCGDWYWMKEIKEELPFYIGNDAAKSLIEKNNMLYLTDKISFIFGDMLTNLKRYKDKEFSLTISRHTFEHLPEEYCIEVIKQLKRVSKFSLITTNNNKNLKNIDIDSVSNGNSRGIYLHREPYMNLLNEPIESFYDSAGEPQLLGCFANLYKF